MKIEELVRLVAPEWQESFLRFVETGEANEAFLSFLDADKACQEAVEQASSMQASAFEEFAGTLSEAPDDTESVERNRLHLSARMASVLRAAAVLRDAERR